MQVRVATEPFKSNSVAMIKKLRIEIVSDVSCPWCVIGYRALDAALIDLGIRQSTELYWKPFQLNPDMPPAGQNRSEHIQQKYGINKQQSDAARKHIEDRGKELDYHFNFSDTGRVHNTFDAHRLIHWAAESGLQTELKLALFDLFFIDQGNTSDQPSLVNTAKAVGLDVRQAEEILHSDKYSKEVTADLELANQRGISAVPCFIFDNKFMISGGQSIDTFKQAITEMLDSDGAGVGSSGGST